MHQVPSVVRLDDVGKRRHRRAVETGHENLVEVVVCGAALEAGALGKIVGPNRLLVAVRKRGSGGTIAAAFGAMALPAFQLGEQLFAMLDALERKCGLRTNGDRVSRFAALPPRWEAFDESDHVRPLVFGE